MHRAHDMRGTAQLGSRRCQNGVFILVCVNNLDVRLQPDVPRTRRLLFWIQEPVNAAPKDEKPASHQAVGVECPVNI